MDEADRLITEAIQKTEMDQEAAMEDEDIADTYLK